MGIKVGGLTYPFIVFAEYEKGFCPKPENKGHPNAVFGVPILNLQ